MTTAVSHSDPVAINSTTETFETSATGSHEAFALYVQGHQEMRDHFPEAYVRAIAQLEPAVKLDPDFARAWAALATAYSKLDLLESTPAADLLSQIPRSRTQGDCSGQLICRTPPRARRLQGKLSPERGHGAHERKMKWRRACLPRPASRCRWHARKNGTHARKE